MRDNINYYVFCLFALRVTFTWVSSIVFFIGLHPWTGRPMYITILWLSSYLSSIGTHLTKRQKAPVDQKGKPTKNTNSPSRPKRRPTAPVDQKETIHFIACAYRVCVHVMIAFGHPFGLRLFSSTELCPYPKGRRPKGEQEPVG